MAAKKIVRTGGVVVTTAITAGGSDPQHSEGVVVSTAISAGGITENHAESFVAPPSDEAIPSGYASGGTSAAGASA